MTAGGPVGNVTLDEGEAGVVEGGDYVFVRDAVPEHAIDHVALEFGQGSHAAMAADFAASGGGGKWFGIDERGSLRRRHGSCD